jgi:hypothetical protein
MNKFLALMIAVIVSAPVVGQSSRPIVFTGKIMDQDTHAPIPYVNMLVADTYMGTSSDRSGSFVMKLAADYAHAEILVFMCRLSVQNHPSACKRQRPAHFP